MSLFYLTPTGGKMNLKLNSWKSLIKFGKTEGGGLCQFPGFATLKNVSLNPTKVNEWKRHVLISLTNKNGKSC